MSGLYSYFPAHYWNLVIFNKNFVALLLFICETSSILFAICFFLSKIIINEKAFYNIIFSLGILSIFFGGTFNNFFAVEYLEDGSDISFMKYDPSWSLFPEYFFKWFLFFPFFAPAVLLQAYINNTIYDDRFGDYEAISTTTFHFFQWQTISNTPIGYTEMWRWNILWIVPPIFIIVFGSLGVVSSRINNISK